MVGNVPVSEDDAVNAVSTFDNLAAPDASSLNTFTSAAPTARQKAWEANELTVASMILVYGLIVIGLSSWLIMKGKDSEAVLRLVAVISAVIIAAFLLVVGYDDKQMNPVIGLLGTIVGYLLGKEQGVRVGAREESARQKGDADSPA
jgi:hypothetical protein